MSTNDGGPAFPVRTTNERGETVTGGPWSSHPGMSLRDWFAGMAMQAIIARDPGWDVQDTTRDAYCTADAMLAERERGVETQLCPKCQGGGLHHTGELICAVCSGSGEVLKREKEKP